ncbi:hypothetical protein DAPPUDRAFT_126310, partial [Daphnia pulex]
MHKKTGPAAAAAGQLGGLPGWSNVHALQVSGQGRQHGWQQRQSKQRQKKYTSSVRHSALWWHVITKMHGHREAAVQVALGHQEDAAHATQHGQQYIYAKYGCYSAHDALPLPGDAAAEDAYLYSQHAHDVVTYTCAQQQQQQQHTLRPLAYTQGAVPAASSSWTMVQCCSVITLPAEIGFQLQAAAVQIKAHLFK